VLGLDRMVVEYETVTAKLTKKQSSWASLSKWFSKQRNVAATTEEVKAEWNGTSFKVMWHKCRPPQKKPTFFSSLTINHSSLLGLWI
jgi:hypothetical protein